MSYDAFISYAKPDRRQASMVCKTLEANGRKVWIAPRDVPPGANWSDAIVKAIDQSRALVVVFSSAANQSKQVFREVDYADNHNVALLLFRIENLEPTGTLRYFTSSTQWIDAWSPPLKAHAEALFRGISPVLASSSEDTAAPPTAAIPSPVPSPRKRSARRISGSLLRNPYAGGWKQKPGKVTDSTGRYEKWLSAVTDVDNKIVGIKHARMSLGVWPFLRGTFYRWVELFPVVCPELALAPAVMATGDLTIESFKTWHDADHRLNWGINYFDEAGALPYTSDLVRLATSAHITLRETGHKYKLGRICKDILSGYEESLNVGGRPFVLEEQTARFRDAMLSNLKNPKTFWARVATLPWTKNVPQQVKEAFAAMMPGISFRMTQRVAGVSSLGRRRFAALGDWKGGKVGWEAKALAPPAMAWLTGQNTPAAEGRNAIVRNSVGNPDPSASVRGHWLISRLSPEFGSRPFYLLSKRDLAESLYAMGWETANIHLSSAQAVKSVKAHLAQRPKNWLKRAVRLMTESTEKDWLQWKKSLRFR